MSFYSFYGDDWRVDIDDTGKRKYHHVANLIELKGLNEAIGYAEAKLKTWKCESISILLNCARVALVRDDLDSTEYKITVERFDMQKPSGFPDNDLDDYPE